ncbi:hypothetical protein HO133_006890 [Letharia lupina]|uniref:GH16 domain-containing protein n=1 Tax=Letharia lupina TaxID=560253 RepID=A0A8H6F6M6_9LECA|nr:uncharacterized protein HO133_006890 [Letharia lupina]KAF6217552.1 hypothetical protein HO133_006890 [Letharia lupina]
MYMLSITLFLLSAVSAIPAHLPHTHFSTQKRTLTPDNTCGAANGYICNPNDPYGGSCCSASGWCGNSEAYCATGSISTYTIGSSPYTQLYTTSNVAVNSETLQLKVPGGQSASPILGAEVSTQDEDILYGSVRTTMKASTVAGTCHGAFFYKDDNQEVDIELITGDTWKGVHYTNQRANADAEASTIQMALPSDATNDFQEYRIDWLPGRTDFYLNGELQQTLTDNVPSTAGSWLWNNWSNGDPGWTGAPPLQDNIMEISKIEMYYNRTSSAGSC